MKRHSLTDYLILYLAKILGLFFRAMPIGAALFIGRCFGRSAMFFNKKRMRIAYANLKSVFAARFSPSQLRKILMGTYANIGQGIVELFLLPKLDKKYVDHYLKFENFHYVKDILKQGKGVIFLTAHFGNWEMANAALPLKGFTYKAIARKQNPYLLNKLLNVYRESKGCKILFKGPAIKEAIQTLHSGGIVSMLVDQDAGKTGVFINLFNRPASWNSGVMEIAMRTGAAIVPGFAIRGKGPNICFKVFKPIIFSDKKADKEFEIKRGFEEYVSHLENIISMYPDQWLWQHRRWKSTPVRRVLILNDGRTGHLRQSEAVADKLKGLWTAKGYKEEDFSIDMVDISFKNNFLKILTALLIKIPFTFSQGRMWLLKSVLTVDSYSKLICKYADFVISCGRSVAGVNLIASCENNAKSIILMKPKLISITKYSLVIAPRHDRVKRTKNVVITEGALNTVSDKNIEIGKNNILQRIGKIDNRCIGLLIGGDTPYFSITKINIIKLLDEVISVCKKKNVVLLVTTSRRTTRDVELIIKERLKEVPICKLLVIANENNITGAVEGIIGLSNVTLVSQDSISMISEAASSDTYTIVYEIPGQLKNKHKKFISNLKTKGYIDVAKIANVKESICRALDSSSKQRVLNDMDKVSNALQKLF